MGGTKEAFCAAACLKAGPMVGVKITTMYLNLGYAPEMYLFFVVHTPLGREDNSSLSSGLYFANCCQLSFYVSIRLDLLPSLTRLSFKLARPVLCGLDVTAIEFSNTGAIYAENRITRRWV